MSLFSAKAIKNDINDKPVVLSLDEGLKTRLSFYYGSG